MEIIPVLSNRFRRSLSLSLVTNNAAILFEQSNVRSLLVSSISLHPMHDRFSLSVIDDYPKEMRKSKQQLRNISVSHETKNTKKSNVRAQVERKKKHRQ